MAPAHTGFIYILTNPSMPGLVKIGRTSRYPHSRAREMSNATGVPTPFVVAYQRQVENCEQIEMQVHRQLSKQRVETGKEFFRVSVEEAIQVIHSVTNVYQPAVKPAVMTHYQYKQPVISHPAHRLNDKEVFFRLLFLPFLLPIWIWKKSTVGRVMVLASLSPLVCGGMFLFTMSFASMLSNVVMADSTTQPSFFSIPAPATATARPTPYPTPDYALTPTRVKPTPYPTPDYGFTPTPVRPTATPTSGELQP